MCLPGWRQANDIGMMEEERAAGAADWSNAAGGDQVVPGTEFGQRLG